MRADAAARKTPLAAPPVPTYAPRMNPSERLLRPCATCGQESYESGLALRGRHITLEERFRGYVYGSPLPPGDPPPDPLTLCIESEPLFDRYRRWFRCRVCDARYISEKREDVNVRFDYDSICDRGYACDPAEWERTLALAQRCPRPDDARCTCEAHTTTPALGREAWYVT